MFVVRTGYNAHTHPSPILKEKGKGGRRKGKGRRDMKRQGREDNGDGRERKGRE